MKHGKQIFKSRKNCIRHYYSSEQKNSGQMLRQDYMLQKFD